MGTQTQRTSFLYEELTGQIIEACFEVSNELGTGFLESVYQKALLIALKDKKLKAQIEFPINVTFRSQVVGQFYADILVDDKVIVELKATRSSAGEHEAQLLNYLKATPYEVGLLLNFGPKPQI